MQWIASPVNDMYADAVLTTVLQIDTEPSHVAGMNVFQAFICNGQTYQKL